MLETWIACIPRHVSSYCCSPQPIQVSQLACIANKCLRTLDFYGPQRNIARLPWPPALRATYTSEVHSILWNMNLGATSPREHSSTGGCNRENYSIVSYEVAKYWTRIDAKGDWKKNHHIVSSIRTGHQEILSTWNIPMHLFTSVRSGQDNATKELAWTFTLNLTYPPGLLSRYCCL